MSQNCTKHAAPEIIVQAAETIAFQSIKNHLELSIFSPSRFEQHLSEDSQPYQATFGPSGYQILAAKRNRGDRVQSSNIKEVLD